MPFKSIYEMKLLIVTLGLGLIMLGSIAFLNWERVKTRNHQINDRELTITSYMKVIEAISRSSSIELEKLKLELQKEFNISSEMNYYSHDKEYYYVLQPKNRNVKSVEIWEFMGLELILDDEKKFKSVNLHKH